MQSFLTAADWSALEPAGIVAVTALVVLLADLVARSHAKRYVSIVLGAAGIMVTGEPSRRCQSMMLRRLGDWNGNSRISIGYRRRNSSAI